MICDDAQNGTASGSIKSRWLLLLKVETKTHHIVATLLKAIAGETFVMVPDACGLAKATRSIFQRHRLKLREYSGEAMSYRVLQEWAELGVGAAILPRSKLAAGVGADILIRKGSKERVTIEYAVSWRGETQEAQALGNFLADVAPSIISGLHPNGVGK